MLSLLDEMMNDAKSLVVLNCICGQNLLLALVMGLASVFSDFL